MSNSRIPGLYRLGVGERIDELLRLGWLADSDAAALRQGRCVLSPAAADKINAVVFLPLFLLEGVAILAEVFVLLIVLMK